MNNAVLGAAILFFAIACGSTTSTFGKDAGGTDAPHGHDAAHGDATGSDTGLGDGSVGSSCRSNTDCSSPAECSRLESPLCGGLPAKACATNKDCAEAGANEVCVFFPCGGTECAPRCTSDKACPSPDPGAIVCSLATGLCGAKPCTGPSDCPANYSCQGSSCSAIKCTHDSDCQGFCVDGLCSKALGTCEVPAV